MRKLIFIGMLAVLIGCSSHVKTQMYSNLTTEKEQIEVANIMKSAGINSAYTFIDWVNDYNSAMRGRAGLAKKWTPLSQIDYKTDEMSTLWDEAHSGEMDANCRLAAFLLMKDSVTGGKISDYGNYLMMDMDEIEKNPRYVNFKGDSKKFIALFNQVSVANAKNDADYFNAFTNAWKQRGIAFGNGRASLISVIMNDSQEKVLFIGHTGVLIEGNGYLLFIEKLSPTMPYQVTRYATRKELKAQLAARPQYTLGDEDFKTFFMENDKIMADKPIFSLISEKQ